MADGFYPRRPWTEERRKMMSALHKRIGTGKWMKGKKLSDVTKNKIRLATQGNKNHRFGKHHSKVSKELMSISHTGLKQKPESISKRIAHFTAEKSPWWKGDKVGYHGLHLWVYRELGCPAICSHCGKSSGTMHWANIDHKYRRNKEDWIRLCPRCHYWFDKDKKICVS